MADLAQIKTTLETVIDDAETFAPIIEALPGLSAEAKSWVVAAAAVLKDVEPLIQSL
jgi:hypothetical protein